MASILTAVNQADAIFQVDNNDYDEDILFLYTAEYGWSAYGIGYSDSTTSLAKRYLIHSRTATAYDHATIDSDGNLKISDESLNSTTPYAVVISDFQTALDTFTDTYLWTHYIQAFIAGQSYDQDADELVDNDISDYDITDYIVGTIGETLYNKFLDNMTTEDAEDTDFTGKDTTGRRALVPTLSWLNSETGRICYDFFCQTYTNQTSLRFAKYIDTAYKLFPGFPGQIVYLASEQYGMGVPDNLLLCTGQIIGNDAVPQLVGKYTPDLRGCGIAMYGNEHIVGEKAGEDQTTLIGANIPALTGFIDSSVSFIPSGTVTATQASHTHSYSDHYMYEVIRGSADVDDNVATESGPVIETGHDDRYTFYWKDLSRTTGSKTPAITASFSGNVIDLTDGLVNINKTVTQQPVDVIQPTYYTRAYMVIY